MRMIEFLNNSADWGDLSMVDEMFHDDYMYLGVPSRMIT